jgi:predicted ABC-type ATPase
LAAGRIFLGELDRLAAERVDFAFESTLSGVGYVSRLNRWKAAGYRIEIVYLKLPSPRFALRRIAERVKEGGHDVPKIDVVRRFQRSWDNFRGVYQFIADGWMVYDNAGSTPKLIERGP